MAPRLIIDPPLLNSACPWATTAENLEKLLESPSTGAVTVRTSIATPDHRGFDHSATQHRYVFFDTASGRVHSRGSADGPVPTEEWNSSSSGSRRRSSTDDFATASLNTLGYSPIPLNSYLDMLGELSRRRLAPHAERKTVIVSVAGRADEVRRARTLIARRRREGSDGGGGIRFPLAMEINLSCPNIPGEPPPAYDAVSLRKYLVQALGGSDAGGGGKDNSDEIPVGIKLPPYTHEGQFRVLADALRTGLGGDSGRGTGSAVIADRLSFATTTNTLGSCLMLCGDDDENDDGDEDDEDEDDLSDPIAPSPPPSSPPKSSPASASAMTPVLPGAGIGGLAGPPLHPLALGNVALLRRVLDADPRLAHIDIVGVGGVSDAAGYRRMRAAGAAAVAVATALGRRGLVVFDEIAAGVRGSWHQGRSSRL